MSDFADEFENESGAVASKDALTAVREGISDLIAAEELVTQLEDDLKAAKKQKQFLATSKLPDLMAEIQSDHFSHAGFDIKVSDFVSGSIPKAEDRNKLAIKWLEDNEGAGIIKTEVSLIFGRSQHNEAADLAGQLLSDGYTPDLKSSVHAGTLCKFAREKLENGEEIDTDVLGLYVGRVAKVKAIKK